MDQLIHIETTGSTNDDMMALVRTRRKDLTDGTTIWADYQTAGRGQQGNRWWSAKGENLLFSTVFFPDTPVSRQFLLTEMASLAVFDALQENGVERLSIKWPNDLYIGEKKVVGMRNETILSGALVDVFITGIGINVNQQHLDFEAPNPTSLINELGRETDRQALMEDLRRCMMRRYNQLLAEETALLHADYMARLFRRNGTHRFFETASRTCIEGSVAGIREDGHLLLRLLSGEVRQYAFKEIRNVFNDGMTLE